VAEEFCTVGPMGFEERDTVGLVMMEPVGLFEGQLEPGVEELTGNVGPGV